MKQHNKCLLVLLSLGILLSCARTPQQLVSEKPEVLIVDGTSEKLKDSVVRVVGLLGTKIQKGSGFFVGPDKIATNIHVVAHPGPIFVKLIDTETVWAVEGVTAYDIKNDLVILKISGEGMPLPLGDSDIVRRGESISVVGFPAGTYKVMTGTIRNTRSSDKRILTTAHTVGGSSGGPLLNSKGQVIGIHVARDEAIPSNVLKALLSQSTQVEPIEQWHKRQLIRAYAYFMLGKTKFAAKDYDNAMIDLDRAIQINPEFIYAYYARGIAKSELGDYNGATVDYDRYIELNSGDAEAYYRRGEAKKSLGALESTRENIEKTEAFYESAIADYIQAIEINPKYAKAYKNQAKVKCKLGDIAFARGDTEKTQSSYHDGITDYDKYIRLNNSEDVDESAAGLKFKKPGNSTVHVMGWIETLDSFFSGSGFFVDTDKIATNIHVVAQPGSVFVKLRDKEKVCAVEGVTAFDAENDLVILKIAGKGIPLSVGDNEAIQNGEPVVVVGYPKKKYRVIKGTIRGAPNGDEWLWMTPYIGSGGSGSPVLNRSDGQVVGINAAGNEHRGYAYAIPSSILKALLAQSEATEPLAKWQKRELIRAYALFVQGQMKYNANHYHEAIADFDKAIKINAQFFYAYHKRGDAKFALGNYEAAIADYDKVININDGVFNIYFDRGLAKSKLGDNEAAIADYDKAIAMDPEHANAYRQRGKAKISLRDFDGAMLDFNSAIQIDPEHADAYKKRAHTKFKIAETKTAQGDITGTLQLYQSAMEDCTQAIWLTPKDADAYDNRGWARFHLGESEAARGNMKKAADLYEKAIADYTQAIKINPEHPYAYRNRGNAKEALEKNEAARADFEKAKEINLDVEQ